ncbi:MAG: tetratricopeptide repeat-containing serine protease family protein [Candidatus Poribacteria bacterium]|nr:tetratricopeptide repeat-containing serine protease family protein [Candidatus Poribacteria bacterium]
MKHKNGFLSGRFLAVITVLLLFCVINTAPAQTTLPAEDIAEKALAATVYLEMKNKNGKTLGFGSGFFVKSNLIATNYHVIEGAASGTAKLVGKSTTYNIEGVTATDKTNDLALLKVTAYGIEPLSLGDSDTVQIGETVYVESQLLGIVDLFSDGIIKSRHHKYTTEFFLMTAPISPGSNGSAVLNRNGKVIAISISSLRDPDVFNLNFAIPSNYLKKLLNQANRAKPLFQGNHIISAETYFKWGNTYYDLGSAILEDLGSAILEAHKLETYKETYKLAIYYYSEAIRQKQNYHEAYNYRGRAKGQLGQPSKAITDFDTAIRLKSDYANAYANRGVSKINLKQYFAAITDFDTAIRLKPDYADAYYNRGIVKTQLGQPSKAIADFDTAIRLKSDYANAYADRGLAKLNLEQYFAAITDFDTAIRLKPDYANAYVGRGIAKAQLGQSSKAIIDFDTAIRLKPDYARAYFSRALAKGLLGHTLEEKQDLQTALELAKKAGDTSLETEIESMLQKIMKVE